MQQANMLLLEADFLFEFAVERVFGRLIVFDSALWELPRALSNALRPKQLSFRVTNYDADIESEAVGINNVSATLTRTQREHCFTDGGDRSIMPRDIL